MKTINVFSLKTKCGVAFIFAVFAFASTIEAQDLANGAIDNIDSLIGSIGQTIASVCNNVLDNITKLKNTVKAATLLLCAIDSLVANIGSNPQLAAIGEVLKLGSKILVAVIDLMLCILLAVIQGAIKSVQNADLCLKLGNLVNAITSNIVKLIKAVKALLNALNVLTPIIDIMDGASVADVVAEINNIEQALINDALNTFLTNVSGIITRMITDILNNVELVVSAIIATGQQPVIALACCLSKLITQNLACLSSELLDLLDPSCILSALNVANLPIQLLSSLIPTVQKLIGTVISALPAPVSSVVGAVTGAVTGAVGTLAGSVTGAVSTGSLTNALPLKLLR